MTSLSCGSSARSRSLSTSGRSKSVRAVPSSFSWAPVMSAPRKTWKTSALSTWALVWSSVWSARKAGSTDAWTAPAGSTAVASRCHTRPSATSNPVIATSPDAHGVKRALLQHDGAGPRVDHERLQREDVGVVVAEVARHGDQTRDGEYA